MLLDTIRSIPFRKPSWVVAAWVVFAAVVGLSAPSLTRLAAEGQSKLLGKGTESRRAAELVPPGLARPGLRIDGRAGLYRPTGLTGADREFAVRLADRFVAADHPREVLRVLGPSSQAEIASRLTSQDGTLSMLVVPLDSAHVSPAAHRTIAWLQKKANEMRQQATGVAGLELRWTGDAVIGRDYMAQVQASLDRAAIATVGLLLVVLLLVYRSFLLALVPLLTIGISLIIARGWLAWLARPVGKSLPW